MSISVLLPVYNAGPPLRQAIDSVLAQDHLDFELIVIEDCSTDGSAGVIRDYAARDGRVRAVYHRQNAGLAATLNEGLQLAGGELVARMDQDDESLPNRLSVQARFMAERPEVAVAGSHVYYMGPRRSADRLFEVPTEPDEIRRVLPAYNPMYHPSVIMRRDEIRELGGYRAEFKNAEDYDLWFRASKAFDIANVPQPLLRYRFSLSGMTLSRKWEQLFYVYLAQTANEEGVASLGEAWERASTRLRETDRAEFFGYVTRGTMTELAALGQWRDAAAMTRRFAAEVGQRNALRLLGELASAYGKHLTAAAGRLLPAG